MNDFFVAARYTAVLAILALLLVAFVRLILGKFRSSGYQTINLEDEILVLRSKHAHDEVAFKTSKDAKLYIRPTFKKNNTEEDMISRSFVFENKDLFDDDFTQMALHMAGLTNTHFVEDPLQ